MHSFLLHKIRNSLYVIFEHKDIHFVLHSILNTLSVQFGSVTQSCLSVCESMDCSIPSLPVHHQFPEFSLTYVSLVDDTIQPSHPLLSPLLPPSIFPSLRDFFSDSVLCIRWPNYWSFNFSSSPSSEYSGLISFRME